jgi:hypothetical protein
MSDPVDAHAEARDEALRVIREAWNTPSIHSNPEMILAEGVAAALLVAERRGAETEGDEIDALLEQKISSVRHLKNRPGRSEEAYAAFTVCEEMLEEILHRARGEKKGGD